MNNKDASYVDDHLDWLPRKILLVADSRKTRRNNRIEPFIIRYDL